MSETMTSEIIDGAVPGRYWHALDDGRVQCDVCPRECRLQEGQRGLCFVRARQNDGIVLTTYGRSSGFCIDPIEKKPLNHFLPGTPVLSFGTAGCNLTCRFCQNWDISKSREFDRLQAKASPEDIARAAQRLDAEYVFNLSDRLIRHRQHGVGTLKDFVAAEFFFRFEFHTHLISHASGERTSGIGENQCLVARKMQSNVAPCGHVGVIVQQAEDFFAIAAHFGLDG